MHYYLGPGPGSFAEVGDALMEARAKNQPPVDWSEELTLEGGKITLRYNPEHGTYYAVVQCDQCPLPDCDVVCVTSQAFRLVHTLQYAMKEFNRLRSLSVGG